MIYFCEDCGAKNQLKASSEEVTGIRFRCSSCDFLNIIETSPTPSEPGSPAVDNAPEEKIFELD